MTEEKNALRKEMKELRASLSPSEKLELEKSIIQAVDDYVQEHKLQTIHVFIPMDGEANLMPLYEKWFAEGKKLIAPKTLENRQLENRIWRRINEVETGKWNTMHPKNNSIYKGDYDLILVPGLAFDLKGYRLGYGAGYYDSFLADYPFTPKIGIAFPFQIVLSVPKEKHDQKVNGICGSSLWEISK